MAAALGAVAATGGLAMAAPGLVSLVSPAPASPPDSFALRTVAAGLDAPTGLVARPGHPGRFYVPQQEGLIRVVEGGHVLPEPFLDLRASVLGGGERGLLGLAFHPDHAKNGRLFVHYTNRRGDTRVVELRARGETADPRSARVVLRVPQPYENHKGGQLAFAPDGRLWLGLGDGGSAFDPDGRGQDLGTRLGKLLRRDVDRPGSRWEIAAFGLRNPWRFSFDPPARQAWVADVGQDAFEEVNVIPLDGRRLPNMGWGAYEGRARQPRPKPLSRRGRLTWPVFTYGRREGCSVTGGFVYRGRRLPALRGRYLLGDLCTGTLWSLRARGGSGPPVRRERPRLPLVTSFGADAAGEPYAVAYDGRLHALVPPEGEAGSPRAVSSVGGSGGRL